MMLIGSAAHQYWAGIEPSCTDFDIIGEKAPTSTMVRIDLQSISDLNNAEFVEMYSTRVAVPVGDSMVYLCSPRGLAILKRSHCHRIHKHDRNMYQLHKELGWSKIRATLSPVEARLLKDRQRMTKTEYKSPSLQKSNEDFFDDYVTKHFDHDWIHEQVAYFDEPLYKGLKRDTTIARCEKDLWDAMHFDCKVKCILEECYVIALERYIVPSALAGERVMPLKIAAIKGVKKVCTTLCSGWFRDFAIDHHPEIIANIETGGMEAFVKENLKCTSL
jgi:hypothetical protein